MNLSGYMYFEEVDEDDQLVHFIQSAQNSHKNETLQDSPYVNEQTLLFYQAAAVVSAIFPLFIY